MAKSKYGFETSPERSLLMSKIKGVNTSPELILRKALWALGVRYRLNVASLSGKPDIVIAKHKLIIFIDSEFFHGFNWEKKKQAIKSNRDYWIPKIERNMKRDKEVTHQLEAKGWTVVRFWANDIKKKLPECLNIILDNIKP